ncbi:hypothetical protein LCGC14_3067150, partial [marine sediment metagenome]
MPSCARQGALLVGHVELLFRVDQARLADREILSREISEIRKELPRVTRLEEAIDMRSVEDNRLSELIMGIRNQIGSLAKEIEERTRQIPFLAEQRTSDTKRIAQLQQETVELLKRVEAVAGRLPVFEENMRKQGAEIEKLPAEVEDLREQQTVFMEKIRATLVDREQVIARWQETIEEQKSMVNQSYERVQNFSQQIEVARRAVHEMQEFKDLILREQSQVQELQRLAEEMRQRIIEVVSRQGGHLASNLGVAELTIALHYVFDFSRDRLLW